jgi:hypothetical protein
MDDISKVTGFIINRWGVPGVATIRALITLKTIE